MSWKIVRQTRNGQRKITVSNGITDYYAAIVRASELEADMIDDMESRGGQASEIFVVEEEGR